MLKSNLIFGSLTNRIKLIFIYFTHKFPYPVSFFEVVREAFSLPYFMIANKYIENITDTTNYSVVKIKGVKRLLYWPKKYSLVGLLVVVAEMLNKHNWHYYQSSNTKVCKGDVIADCGASEGLFTVLNENLIKKSYLFEPSAHFVSSLKKTFQNNNQKIEIVNCALSDKNQTISFNDDSISGKVDKNKNNKNKINAVTLDSYFYKHNIKVDYIKADIEGWEYYLIAGGQKTIKKYRPKIAITSYHVGNDYKKLIDLVLKIEPKYNYKVVGFSAFTIQPVMLHFWI